MTVKCFVFLPLVGYTTVEEALLESYVLCISSDARLQKYNSLLCMLYHQRPEKQLCGLSHQSDDDD